MALFHAGWLRLKPGAVPPHTRQTRWLRRWCRCLLPRIGVGVALTIFPEGKSTRGDRVLAFHSSLLAPAAQLGWPVTPAFIRYEVDGGVAEEDVAYWRDMTFIPHFLKRLGKAQRSADRKALARGSHRAVAERLASAAA